MKITLIKSLIPILVLSDVALSQTWPEPPAIWREVTGIRYRSATNLQPEHQRPHMPTYRTTRDGRIAINPKTSQFTLIIPEKLTGPLLRTPASTKANNSFVIRHTSDFRLINPSTSAQYTTEDAHRAALFPLSTLIQQGKLPQNTLGSMGHVTLFDPTPADSTTGEITNPKNVNGKDVYTLTVVGAFVHDISDPNTNNADKMRIWSTNVEVTVSNPKKTNAVIEKIERIDDTLVGPAYPFTNAAGLEVSVADRGRLLVMRIAGGVPAASLNLPESKYNIVYSFTTSNPSFKVDPTKWTAIHPISHAPYDSRINTELGFALKPFRDAAGNEIPDNREFGATYPWIDPDAKNLFFTVIGDILKHRGKTFGTMVNGVYTPNPNINSESRFPNSPTFSGQIHSTAAEDFGPTRGVSFVGLWSNGKIVTIDNLNNDMDYQIDGNYFSRNVRLYQNVDSTWKNLVLGGGRVNGPDILGDVDNTGFIESMQNTYNYNQNSKPTTLRDVVWTMQNPKHTDELAFDDYMDRDALIIANMNGCVMMDTTKTNDFSLDHQNGYSASGTVFTSTNVKLQNAATPSSTNWNIPKFGAVTGPGRLEPAAAGGIYGKGFWLDSTIGLRFAVPKQSTSVDVYQKNWYVGLFIDCRDDAERQLLTFPDGTSIRLVVNNSIPTINYFQSNENSAGSVTIAQGIGNYGNMIPDPGWAHLAWQIKKGGKEIDFLLNGMLYNRLTRSSSQSALFQMAIGSNRNGGDLVVGNTSSSDSLNGFRGWIDDLKVIARTVDPESACNHAGGTLVGLRQSYPSDGDLWDFNYSFPTHNGKANGLAIDEINLRLRHNGHRSVYSGFANIYDYDRDRDAQTVGFPAGADSLRQRIHFPEGPVFKNRPRPNSIKNQFCLTCHHDETNAQGLGLAALIYDGGLNAPQDHRRMPSQAFRRIFGNIPIGLATAVSPVQPTTAGVAPTAGRLVDDLVLKNASTPIVYSFSLVDANTNQEVAILRLGQTATVSRTAFTPTPTVRIAVRVNLSFAQGNVALTLNGASRAAMTPVGTIAHPSPSGDTIPYATDLGALANGTYTVAGTPTGGTVQSASFTLTN